MSVDVPGALVAPGEGWGVEGAMISSPRAFGPHDALGEPVVGARRPAR